MDKPSPNNPHLHDWLGTQSFNVKPFDASAFDPKQLLEGMAGGFGPMKALTVQQIELMTLASRRAQAYLGVPQRLSHCRSHSDLVNEQMRFWQTAMSQYQDAATRIFGAWSELFSTLPQAAMKTPGSAGVTFPKPPAATSPRSRTAGRSADIIQVPSPQKQ